MNRKHSRHHLDRSTLTAICLALLLTAFAPVDAARTRLSPSRVEALEVAVDTSSPRLPGTSMDLDIRVSDKRGRSYSLAEGTLDPRFLQVTSTLAEVDLKQRQLHLSSDVGALTEQPYGLEVRYGKGKRLLTENVTIEPDLAALLGPEPGDVAEFRLELSGASELPEQLAPDRTLQWVAVVRDRAGRVYRSDRQHPTVPARRLQVSAQGLMFGSALRATTDVDHARESGSYTVTATYAGRDDLQFTAEFAADLAATFGPEPADVTSIEVTPHSVKGDRLAPGATFDLEVIATDRAGRRYSTHSDELQLPAERLRFDLERVHRTADGFTADPDCQAVLYEPYRVAVSYAGRPDTSQQMEFAADIVAALRQHLLTDSQIVGAGRDGGPGQDGEEGAPGQLGQGAYDVYGAGSPGTIGGPGGRGAPGRNGGRGPSIEARLAKVAVADRSDWLILGEVLENGAPVGGRRFFLRTFDQEPLTLVSRGGAGGPGGSGGAGGDGGRGGQGWSTGDGGPGGNGGEGGAGGVGGDGGDVMVWISGSDVRTQVMARSEGGAGGAGGGGGRAGDGGLSGKLGKARGVGAVLGALAGDQPPPGTPGRSGYDGQEGYAGQQGRPGGRGAENIQVDSSIADQLRARIPAEVASCLWFPQ